MASWSVRLMRGTFGKEVASNVPTEELWSYIATCFDEGACALVRMDQDPDTWKFRASQLIDVTEGENKDGKPYTRRSVRYGKIDKKHKKKGTIQNKKMTMEDWNLLMRLNTWKPKPRKKALSREASFECPKCGSERCGWISRGRCYNSE